MLCGLLHRTRKFLQSTGCATLLKVHYSSGWVMRNSVFFSVNPIMKKKCMAVYDSFCILQKAVRWLTIATVTIARNQTEQRMTAFIFSNMVWMKCFESLMRWNLHVNSLLFVEAVFPAVVWVYICLCTLLQELSGHQGDGIWMPSSDLIVSVCVLRLPVSVHVQDCGPVSSCESVTWCRSQRWGRRPAVTARVGAEAEVSTSTCHPAATPSLHSLWDKLQL